MNVYILTNDRSFTMLSNGPLCIDGDKAIRQRTAGGDIDVAGPYATNDSAKKVMRKFANKIKNSIGINSSGDMFFDFADIESEAGEWSI